MMLHSIRCDQTPLSWDEFTRKLPTKLQGMRDGLYVFLFLNSSNEYVLDNNPKPKTVIHQAGASLKPGKFEQGLAVRLKNYHDHLHWTETDGTKSWVFTRCFRRGFVFDLSNRRLGLPSTARVFERYWTESVNIFLQEHKLLASDPIRQLSRAEWRYLNPSSWNETVDSKLETYLNALAERIVNMVATVHVP